jgi:hypothetical protein
MRLRQAQNWGILSQQLRLATCIAVQAFFNGLAIIFAILDHHNSE